MKTNVEVVNALLGQQIVPNHVTNKNFKTLRIVYGEELKVEFIESGSQTVVETASCFECQRKSVDRTTELRFDKPQEYLSVRVSAPLAILQVEHSTSW